MLGNRYTLIYIALISFLSVTYGQGICNRQSSCRDCFAVSSPCRWCGAKDWNGPRCATVEQLFRCPYADIRDAYDVIPQTPECNGHDQECGVCKCGIGTYGDNCECEVGREEEDIKRCKMSPTAQVCSGRGRCVCGQCECRTIFPGNSRRYTGAHCECDDYSCDYSPLNQKLCGGPEMGICRCGNCFCRPGYSGRSCECPLSTSTCMASNGVVCNGKGRCDCGRCVCDLDTYYAGPTCEDCPTCPGKCTQLKDCVRCRSFGTGPLTQEACAQCETPTRIFLLSDTLPDTNGARFCQFIDDDDCTFKFTYMYRAHIVEVRIQLTKICSPRGK